jgi:HSP20 family protein
MTLVRWDPLRNLSTLQDRINRMFNDAFPSSKYMDDELALSGWKPVVDIYETKDSVVIHAELPGIKKEEVAVDVKGNVLTIKGERSFNKEVKEENYYRKERSYGSFHRAFTLPLEVDPDKIKAKFKDGVLEIEVPKPEAEKPKQITVKVE